MVDVIKASFQIGIQDILGLVINDRPDSCDCILTTASWAEAKAIWLEFGFPGWFERKLREGLMRFCILYTCCSNLRQGNVRQLSLSGSGRDCCLVLGAFVFVIRLVPLSSIPPCSRLHILGITPGIRFLSNPSLRGIGWHLLIVSTTDKSEP